MLDGIIIFEDDMFVNHVKTFLFSTLCLLCSASFGKSTVVTFLKDNSSELVLNKIEEFKKDWRGNIKLDWEILRLTKTSNGNSVVGTICIKVSDGEVHKSVLDGLLKFNKIKNVEVSEGKDCGLELSGLRIGGESVPLVR